MKVPRKADDRTEDLSAYCNPFFDGLRRVRVRLRGRYVEKAHKKERKKRLRA
jgi:hypothetical protein